MEGASRTEGASRAGNETGDRQEKGGTIDARELAIACARVAEEKKGVNIKVLEVSDIMALTDFFVLVTGSNPRHIKALADDITKTLKKKFDLVPSIEGTDAGWWVLLDAGAVIIHLFEEQARRFYELDELWADAKPLKWNS